MPRRLGSARAEKHFTLTGAGDPVEVPGQLVSGQLFSVMGVKPLLGRLLTPADDRPRWSLTRMTPFETLRADEVVE